MPKLLQLAVVAPMADSYLPGVTVWLTNWFIAVFGAIGRLAGYKPTYPQYSL